MTEKIKVPIHCGDKNNVTLVLDNVPLEDRKRLLDAYTQVMGGGQLEDLTKAAVAISVDELTRLTIVTSSPSAQVVKMHTLASLIKLVGLEPELLLTKASK